MRPGVWHAENMRGRRGISRASDAEGILGIRSGRACATRGVDEAEGGELGGHSSLNGLLDVRVQCFLGDAWL